MNFQRWALMLPAEPSLVGLPTEVFLKILSERDEVARSKFFRCKVMAYSFFQLRTKRSLRSLRLVCRKVDHMVRYLALESVTLPRDPSQVQAMATKPNSFDTVTRVLRIEGHRYPSSHSTTWQTLGVLIRKMKGLHTVQCV